MAEDIVSYRFAGEPSIPSVRIGGVYVQSGIIGKYYPDGLILWSHEAGFEFESSVGDGKDAQRQKAGPTPEQIATFKADLELQATVKRSVAAFLEKHPELMTDNRVASFGEAYEIRSAKIDATLAGMFTLEPAEVRTGTSRAGEGWEYVAKSYEGYRMSWDPKVGFSIIRPHTLTECQAFETVPGPDQIARFKSDLRHEAGSDLKLAAFLVKHQVLMTDDRAISFAAAHEAYHPELKSDRLPLPPAFTRPVKPGAPDPKKRTL